MSKLDEPAWAMLQALDVWGGPFLKALDNAEDYEAWLSATPADIAQTLAMSSVTGDIANGGTDQCFWNSFGTAAPEALLVLRAVGLDRYAHLVEQAVARFGPVFPRSREVRMAALETGEVDLSDIDNELIALIIAYDGEDERRLNDFAANVLRRYSA